MSRTEEPRRLLQLDLDAVGQHPDVADLVGLAAEAQLFGCEGAKNSALQQFLRDQATDLLQAFGVVADPIAQSKAQASWLRGIMAESTGRKCDVFPVLLFPGWYTEQAPDTRRALWLLEPKALPAFLQREPPEDCKLFAFHLSRFIRGVERAAALN